MRHSAWVWGILIALFVGEFACRNVASATDFPPPVPFPTPDLPGSGNLPRSIEFSQPLPIQPDTAPSSAPVDIRPVITPLNLGDGTVPVLSVEVLGGTTELHQRVQETVQTKPGEPTSEQQLQDDVAAILGTGLFTHATVYVDSLPDGVNVVYEVEPVVVRSLQLSGAQALTPAVANQVFQPQLGRPISPTGLQRGVDLINQWYFDNGYKLSQVVEVQPSHGGVITIEVTEPIVRQVNIRFVNEAGSPTNEAGDPISGRTQEAFLRQQIQTQPGQVFNEETARQDLQRLIALGLFDSATADLDVDASTVDMTYNLTERLSRNFNLGGGYSTDVGLYGTVTYQDLNFSGIGERLHTNVQVSGQGLQFGSRFTSPYRESHPDRLGYSIHGFRRRTLSPTFTDEVELPNGDRAREGRLGGGVSVMRPLGEWDAELGLNYTRTSIRDSDGDRFSEDELGNPLTLSETGIDDLFTLSFQATQDRRDNPTNPRQGSVLTLRTEQSAPIGNGDILMNRLHANYAHYFPVDLIGNASASEPEVLAFNVQGGTILGDLPPYEAFNLGGANSVRGYAEGDVGTGRSYAQASMEYRFPVFSPVGGVLFADFATDLGTADDVPGEPAIARDKPGTGFGLGLGVRVRTPLGLLRLDYGFSDEGDSRLHFGFGQRF
jgi:outer membrane protein insertion porin family